MGKTGLNAKCYNRGRQERNVKQSIEIEWTEELLLSWISPGKRRWLLGGICSQLTEVGNGEKI